MSRLQIGLVNDCASKRDAEVRETSDDGGGGGVDGGGGGAGE